LIADIHVIYVSGIYVNGMPAVQHFQEKKEALTETVILFRRTHTRLGRLLAYYHWRRHIRRAIRTSVSDQGMPDLIHVHIPMKAGMQALWMKRKYKLPYIVTEHWGIYNETERLNYGGRSSFFRRMTKRIFSGAAAFTSVSHFLAQGVNRLVVKKDYVIVPNVVDTTLFHVLPRAEKKPFTFVHVSNMVPLKNTAGILRSYRKFLESGSDAVLVMIGNRDNSLEDLAKTMDFPDGTLEIRGEIAYQEVAKEMQAADCLILFSDIENAPCVISEAHCCGLPVIATNTGGIPELVNAANGVLIQPRDEMDLTNAMGEMIKTYARFDRSKIAADAQSLYSYAAVAKQFATLYEAHIKRGA
jgi:glycosyltransferase involved in cell wall biosynthesis